MPISISTYENVSASALLEAMISAFIEPVIAISDHQEVIGFNAAARALFPSLEVAGALALAVRDPIILDATALVVANREKQERLYSRRVPQEQFYDVIFSPLATGGALIIWRDLSTAKALERMRVDFVAHASHELRTPLTAIIGFIDTLEGSARDDAPMRQTFLKIMREQANRMRRLINDLLSLSSIEAKVHVVPQAHIDLITTVREALEALQILAQSENVALHFSALSDCYMVYGDRDELIRVAENLIENAIKYGGSGGQVSITLENALHHGRREIHLVVQDYGIGISHEHIARLTERFYRVDETKSRAKGGTGLGLSIVKHIISRHQGRLEIASQLGQGTTFRACLPQVSSD